MRSEKQLMSLVVTLVFVLASEVNSGQAFAGFDPQRHHLLLLSTDDQEHSRVKRSLEIEDDVDLGEIEDEVEHDFYNETAKIYSCHVSTDIRYRYARTQVTSRVINKNRRFPSEVIFTMVLPEAAFISKFLMEVDGKVYNAHVKTKEEAKDVYVDAQNRGQGAGLVEVNARHANVFNVNLNVKPNSKVTFNLTYEEFLIRKLGFYEQIVHIRPEQIAEIEDFKISVQILESQNITKIQVPNLVTNEILAFEEEMSNMNVNISQPSGNYAIVNWRPSRADQELMVRDTGIKFVVRYDIHRDSGAGEILLMNGYFVHFFAPSDVLPMRKHVVYVLDVSGSMSGRKIQQMKHVMSTVMDDLKPDDYFNIIFFSSDSKVVMPAKSAALAEPIMATELALREAHQLLASLTAHGGTNIDAALRDALAITSRVKPTPQNEGIGTLPENVESLILFLTDGDPTVGVTRPETIISNAKQRNSAKVPIYAISFGLEPDFGFLKKLSLENFGFARKIYEGVDADVQIRGFYKEISSPLLSNITFKYTTNSSVASVRRLTKQNFPSIFTGSEIVVAGYVRDRKLPNSTAPAPLPPAFMSVDIDANGRNGRVTLTGDDLTRNAYDLMPLRNNSVTSSPADMEDEFLERLWAYITIKQLLEIHPNQNGTDDDDYVYEDFGEEGLEEVGENEPINELEPRPIPLVSAPQNITTARDRALNLALKYGFVTPITSLVVVKREEPKFVMDSKGVRDHRAEVTDVINLKEASAQIRAPLPPRGNRMMPGPNWPTYSSSYSLRSYPPAPPPTNTRHASTLTSTSAQDRAAGPPGLNVVSARYVSPAPQVLNKMVASFENVRSTASLMSHVQALKLNNNQRQVAAIKFSGAEKQRQTVIAGHYMTFDGATTPVSLTILPQQPMTNRLAVTWPFGTDPAGKSFLLIYGTKYLVRNDDEYNFGRLRAHPCTGGTRHNRFQGTCQHLRDCVRPEFQTNFEIYVNQYFCGISRNGVSYAGVCCS